MLMQLQKSYSPPTDLKIIKPEVVSLLYDAFGGVVQSGPFEGMKILRAIAWQDTHLAPLVIGCYEEELHGVIRSQIRRLNKLEKPTISVVGCAEGYYAIGMARAVPKATVYVVDIHDKALEVCEANAAWNNVSVTKGAPLYVFLDADLIIMDVEGAETEYLNPVEFPMLLGRTIIVEIHDWEMEDGKKVGQVMLERFQASHRITMITEGPRNPNQYSFLFPLSSDYRWAAMSEGRYALMCWYVMEPKGILLSA